MHVWLSSDFEAVYFVMWFLQAENRWQGVCLLGVTCQKCTRQKFLESYNSWFLKLLESLKVRIYTPDQSQWTSSSPSIFFACRRNSKLYYLLILLLVQVVMHNSWIEDQHPIDLMFVWNCCSQLILSLWGQLLALLLMTSLSGKVRSIYIVFG